MNQPGEIDEATVAGDDPVCCECRVDVSWNDDADKSAPRDELWCNTCVHHVAARLKRELAALKAGDAQTFERLGFQSAVQALRDRSDTTQDAKAFWSEQFWIEAADYLDSLKPQVATVDPVKCSQCRGVGDDGGTIDPMTCNLCGGTGNEPAPVDPLAKLREAWNVYMENGTIRYLAEAVKGHLDAAEQKGKSDG